MPRPGRKTGRAAILSAGAAILLLGGAFPLPARMAPHGLGSSESASALSHAAAASAIVQWQKILASHRGASSSLKPIILTDTEVNSYLKFDGAQMLPRGIYNTRLHISQQGIFGSAIVDFDELNRAQGQNGGAGLGLLGMIFSGRQVVSALGNLSTWNRQGRINFQNVHIGSTQLSEWLVNWLLQAYVESKYKVNLDKPFALPGDVTRIILEPGQAIFERAPHPRR